MDRNVSAADAAKMLKITGAWQQAAKAWWSRPYAYDPRCERSPEGGGDPVAAKLRESWLDWFELQSPVIDCLRRVGLDSIAVRNLHRLMDQYGGLAGNYDATHPAEALHDAILSVEQLVDHLQAIVGTPARIYSRDQLVTIPQVAQEHGKNKNTLKGRVTRYRNRSRVDKSLTPFPAAAQAEDGGKAYAFKAGFLADARIIPADIVEPAAPGTGSES